MINFQSQLIIDHSASTGHDFTGGVFDIGSQNPAENSTGKRSAQCFGRSAGDDPAFSHTAVISVNHDILGHIHQTAGQISGVSTSKSRVRHNFSGTVRVDELFQTY